jgi:hypothetical protein
MVKSRHGEEKYFGLDRIFMHEKCTNMWGAKRRLPRLRKPGTCYTPGDPHVDQPAVA